MMTKMPQKAFKAYLAQTRFLFHCQFKIKIPQHYGESLLDACFELLEHIDLTYNSYRSSSYFDRINQHAGEWVETDDAVVNMLKQIKLISAATYGAFDISCMPLLRLWGFYKEEKHCIPEQDEIANTLQQVDYRAIKIEQNRVRIPANMELMTGSFIKSFAVDELVKFLKAKGVTDAIINAGGSSIYAINDEMHPDWKVNIPDPHQTENIAQHIKISNQCFSLSARAHNSIIINGKPYGHILNCNTGNPASALQVGVCYTNAFLADCIATALFSVEDDNLLDTVKRLKKIFPFQYFRISGNGQKISDTCFSFPH